MRSLVSLSFVGYSPPPIAGHSASVIGDRMIVFGGSHGQGSRTNEVWVLDLIELTWSRRDIFSGRQPNPRYGQTQITLDDNHILIIGGCGGANMLFRLVVRKVDFIDFEVCTRLRLI